MTDHTEMQIPDTRRDQIAEKVMFLLLDKDNQWSRDPRPLAARSYAIADAMINQSKIRSVDK